jgi:chaperone modulatory protein CbpM
MTDIVMSISLQELCQCEGLSEPLIIEIVDHGIAEPVAGTNTKDWVFEATSVHWLRKAVRLHNDLDIDWIAVSMLIDLLRKNEALQRQNESFQQQLRRFCEG